MYRPTACVGDILATDIIGYREVFVMGSVPSTERLRREAEIKIGEGVRERNIKKIKQGVKTAEKASLPDVVFSGQLSPFKYAVDESFVEGVEAMLKVCMLLLAKFTLNCV